MSELAVQKHSWLQMAGCKAFFAFRYERMSLTTAGNRGGPADRRAAVRLAGDHQYPGERGFQHQVCRRGNPHPAEVSSPILCRVRAAACKKPPEAACVVPTRLTRAGATGRDNNSLREQNRRLRARLGDLEPPDSSGAPHTPLLCAAERVGSAHAPGFHPPPAPPQRPA